MTISLLLASIASAQAPADGIQLGSYGRAQVGTDTEGHGASPATIAIPTRLVKAPYLELDLAWTRTDPESGARFDAVVTPALVGALFHYDGAFDGDLTLRNLYASAQDAVASGVEAWAGSRMVRGDDVYLLDTWVLDNLNVVGGGGAWKSDTSVIRLTAGLNRLAAGDWQAQSIPLPSPGTIGTQQVTVLDRQRGVAALTADHALDLGGLVLRPRLHGELHRLPAGTRRVEDGAIEQPLPAGSGAMGGLQLSLWGWAPESYAHLFVRRATGLAATGLLDVPREGFAPDLTVTDATQDVLALAANHETPRMSLAAGIVGRRWTDADLRVDADDGWDLSWALRPALKVGAHGSLGLEVAQEQSWREGLDPRSGAQELARIERLSVLPALQLRQGTFGRPQVRLQYTLGRLNEAARARFDPADARAQRATTHWLGVGAEWWIDSRSYR